MGEGDRSPLHAEHPERCSRRRDELRGLPEEPCHRPDRLGLSAGQPEEVRPAGQADPLQPCQAPLGRPLSGRDLLRR